MARGWESKSVEDQIGEAEAERLERATQSHLSAAERERTERRQSLLLSRSQIISRLKMARNQRYRNQLEAALKHLDEELEKVT
jgi:hypothetical protein